MTIIVIVDDRATNQAIYSKLAKSSQDGVVVRAFKVADDALAWLAENDADLIVTDYKMPGMNGAEFTRRIRALPLSSEVPVVVITAYHDKSFRLEALEAGATDFLESPVDHAEFITRVRNLLKMSWQHKVIRDRAVVLEQELSTTLHSREVLMRESRERLAQVIDTVPALISATDREGRCIFVNAHQTKIAGLGPQDPAGARPLFGDVHRTESQALDQIVLQSGHPLPSYEEEITTNVGVELILLTTKTPLTDADGKVIGVLTASTDITERKLAEKRLLFVANHDYLTSLPNRACLQERLQQALARGRRGDRLFALHLIDLDQFKGVNDGLGHHYGDRLLKVVAARLRELVQDDDLVARIGGDEFAVLQTSMQSPEDATALAQRVIESLAAPIQLDQHEVFVGASVGITLHPKDGADPDELLQNADAAMYRVKLAGRNGFALFSNDMLSQAKDSIVLQSALARALPHDEFVVHYQPQVDLRTGTIIGAEALLRWSRPGWGLLSPSEFLPAAEQSGLILGANEWVLNEACRRAAEWAAEGMPIRVAVNLSPLQFKKCDITALVAAALSASGLPANLLDLELTENILTEHAEAASAQLTELHRRGVFLSIDDFGIGYSSLTRLMSFRVDRLKIDRSFVGDMRETSHNTAIVRAIVGLGRALNLEVLAEGVETIEQVHRLREEGCDAVQGYYYGRPVVASEFAALHRGWQADRFLEERRLDHTPLDRALT